jgi:hypothetical protein
MDLGILIEDHSFKITNLNDEEWATVPAYGGARLLGRAPVLQARLEGTQPAPDFFTVAGKPLVSAPLRRRLENTEVSAEFLPSEIELPGHAQSPEPYYFMNILEVIDCIDEQQSRITRHPKFGYVQRIERLVLKPFANIGGSPLFRPKSLVTRIFAEESVRNLLKEMGASGLLFCPLHKYRFPSTELIFSLRTGEDNDR